MSTFNWRDYVRELTPQERFATACFGGSQNNFVYARDYLAKHSDLDIPSVVGNALWDTDFLTELFTYYHKNVVDKLQTIKERHSAMEELKKAVKEEILKNGWETLPKNTQEAIDKEFPDDDRRIEGFEPNTLHRSDASTSSSEDEDGGAHGHLLGGASGNGFSYGDWEALLAAH